MYISGNDIKEFGGEDGAQKLRDFLERKISEGYNLDYKRAAYEENDSGKREFLKDVTGFANANGGNLIIGCDEPTDDTSVDGVLFSVQNGDRIAQNYERRCADSIDPRISGLRVVPVKLEGDRWVIVVHVPPSLARPHMVNFKKHRSFYIRHTESSVPMSTHEIREAVLSAATAEGRAKDYLAKMEEDALKYSENELPMFLLQAMPLIPNEQLWDVFSEQVIFVLNDKDRERTKKYAFPRDLSCPNPPKPTIDGIKHVDGTNSTWTIEAHRNGYVSVAYWVPPHPLPNKEEDVPYLVAKDAGLFSAFAEICNKLLEVTSSDSPYLVSCKCFYANTLSFVVDNGGWGHLIRKYEKDEIVWPLQLRQPGEGFETITKEWIVQLYNAFGMQKPA